LFSQNEENLDLLITENTWRKEAFPLPIPFAPEIKYKGVEEAQFSKGWSNPESEEFWTYVFLWHIDLEKELTERELEVNLQYYFDGLMKIINKDTSLTVPPTIALFLKDKNVNEHSIYKGKVNFYDAFFTKKTFTLNILVEQGYCKEKNKYDVLFKFSPKDLNHPIWEDLGKIKVNPKIGCDKD